MTRADTARQSGAAPKRTAGRHEDNGMSIAATLPHGIRLDPPAAPVAEPLQVTPDATTFAGLYEAHVDRIYTHVRARLGDPDLAEDLTAQTFLRAWQSIDRYRPLPGRPFLAWLFTIANNLVIDHYRRHRRELIGVTVEPRDGGGNDPEYLALVADLRDEIRLAIARLKPDHQLVVALRLIDGLDYQQISEITGRTPGALRVILCRALGAMRELLRRRGVDSL
jgi:RNA polymerase sigma-70 factor (ECF subfamily)